MDYLHLLGFRLAFTRDTQLHFFHHPALYAMLLDRLGNPRKFPVGVALYAPERARVHYRAGQPYRFCVALHPHGPISPTELCLLVDSRPNTAYGNTEKAPFGDNYDVEEAADLIFGDPHPENGAAVLTDRVMEPAAQKLAAANELTIRFVSPLLILRYPAVKKTFVMDGEFFSPGKFLERVVQRVCEWWPEAEFCGALPELPPPGSPVNESFLDSEVEVTENRLIRTDVSYPKKRLLGSSGTVTLRFKKGIGKWAKPLLLAGIVGVGKGRNMGQGRFEVVDHPLPLNWPLEPAQTILERAANDINLEEARKAIMQAGPAPGIDGKSKEAFADNLSFVWDSLRQKLASGKIQPSPLRGVLIHEELPGKTKIRPLAVPTMEDRFLQRAVLQEMDSAVEQLLEDSSFAFRRGLSHKTAIRGVDQARKEGFAHVLDADIRSFFDEIDWDLMRSRLEAYFGSDPVVDLLMKWIQVPVEFEGRTIQRERGLPQGAVVSPILANLYLDALDESLECRGFRLVRFADDFVIMCKNQGDVKLAKEIVTDELSRLRLALHTDKTVETSFEQGFKFLGAMFCRSAIIELDKGKERVRNVLTRSPGSNILEKEKIVPVGWFSDFLEKYLPQNDDSENDEKDHSRRWRKPLPPPSSDRRSVYIVSRGSRVLGKKQGLFIEREDESPRLVPWREISELVMLGGNYMSPSVIQKAMRYRIPIAFHKWNGEPLGLVLPDRVRSPSPVALRQWEWNREKGEALKIARLLIGAKIHNTQVSSRRRSNAPELKQKLKELERQAKNSDSSETLRGIEGRAAHIYFSYWDLWLDEEITPYPGRITRGATDPVNVALNFLYTQLFRLTHTTILSTGLDPYLGVLHEGGGRYAALAADLMEPFRFLVDRLVITLFNRKVLGEKDFRRCEKGPYKLLLLPDALKRCIEEWEKQLAVTVADGRGVTENFRGQLFRQAERLAKHVENDKPFWPFRMKW